MGFQRGLGAALGTFGRVLGAQRQQRADIEAREREEEARRQAALQEMLQRSAQDVAGATTTPGLNAALAGVPAGPVGQGVRQQGEAMRQPIKQGEGRAFLEDLQKRVAGGETVADIIAGSPSSTLNEELSGFSDEERDKDKLGLLKQQMRVSEGERQVEALDAEEEDRKRRDQELQEEAAERDKQRLDLAEREFAAKQQESGEVNQTEGMRRSGQIATMAAAASETLDSLEASGDISGVTGGGMLPNYALKSPNPVASQAVQSYNQAKNSFSNLIFDLSGAAVTAEERAQKEIEWFAQPGDTPETLAQKQRAREVALQAAFDKAGIRPEIDRAPPGGGGGDLGRMSDEEIQKMMRDLGIG